LADHLRRDAKLVAAKQHELTLSLREVDEVAKHFKINSLSPNTREAYAYRIWAYACFCEHHGEISFPAASATLVRFFAAFGVTRSPGTLAQARAAIAHVLKRLRMPDTTRDPDVVDVLEGHARRWPGKSKQKAALTTDDIIAIVDVIDREKSLIALRDKAILLLSYTGALRRSEATSNRDHAREEPEQIDALEIGSIVADRKGISFTLRRSKTNQKGSEDDTIYVSYATRRQYCAVLAVLRWIDALRRLGIEEGPLFPQLVAIRNGQHRVLRGKAIGARGWVVNLKMWAKEAGFDPTMVGGHSLRRGHVTQAGKNNAPILSIAKQGRWRNINTVMRYYDHGKGHANSTSGHLGL
jgi:integrase